MPTNGFLSTIGWSLGPAVGELCIFIVACGNNHPATSSWLLPSLTLYPHEPPYPGLFAARMKNVVGAVLVCFVSGIDL